MTEENAPRWTAGETALLITVPEADPVVGAARAKYGPVAGAGVPAHVTVLYPFLPAERIDAETVGALRELFAGHDPFELRFTAFGRFPGLLWLAPEPDGPVRALTSAVTARWPEAPPYGGAFDDPIPHLTVADSQPEETYAALEREFGARLPLRTRVTGIRLVVCGSDRWHLRETFPLGEAAGTANGTANGRAAGTATRTAVGAPVQPTG